MQASFAGIVLAMEIAAQPQPPQILQIHREPLKAGSEPAYDAIEADIARVCSELGGPHPYLAIEALTGPTEVWYFNGYNSPAEQQQVADAYAKNAALMAALRTSSERKASLTGQPIEVFATLQKNSSRGSQWVLGQGRFLVITVTTSQRPIAGTVFAAPDGTRFIVKALQTRKEADAAAALAGLDTNIFAVRPSWSFPAKEWVVEDPVFWQR